MIVSYVDYFLASYDPELTSETIRRVSLMSSYFYVLSSSIGLAGRVFDLYINA